MKGISSFYNPNHSQKSQFFKFLDKLPSSLGFYLYHKIQSLYAKQNLEFKIQSTDNSYLTVDRILKTQNIDLKDSFCIEIGSGWLPVFPYLLKIKGKINKLRTYDVNRHYKVYRIKKLNKYFEKLYPSEKFHYHGKYNLLDGIQYFPKTNIDKALFNKADFVFSRFVLEHISPEEIIRIHDIIFNSISNNAYILHLISPNDHRAYSDKSISLYDFLKYSSKEWNDIQTKFDYHNRLRLPQYMDILKNKFEIIYFEYSSCKTHTNEYIKFQDLKIHNDFKDFSFEELTAGSINILLKKKNNK